MGRVRKGDSEGGYVSRFVAGSPKLKASFLSPNASDLFTLFFFVSSQPHPNLMRFLRNSHSFFSLSLNYFPSLFLSLKK